MPSACSRSSPSGPPEHTQAPLAESCKVEQAEGEESSVHDHDIELLTGHQASIEAVRMQIYGARVAVQARGTPFGVLG